MPLQNAPLRFSRLVRPSVFAIGLLAVLAACDREHSTPTAAAPPPPPVAQPAPPPAAIELKDISESTPQYLIGVTYPPAAAKYPGLAKSLHDYTEAGRADLLKAVAGMKPGQSPGPYDLTLSYTLLAETPDVVAVAADGSSFTGGAHGTPLVARFVWLPQQNAPMTGASLFSDPKAWTAVSDFAREQLHTQLSQSIEEENLAPAVRAQQLEMRNGMIDEGTGPKPESFALFEPVMTEAGKLRALRFVFAPGQVAAYVEGVRTVDVPTEVFQSFLAPQYRDLFVVAPPPAPAAPADAQAPQPAR